MKKFLTIIVTAIISSIVLSLLIALLFSTPTSEQVENEFYWPIHLTFIFLLYVLTMPFIVGGVVGVLLMDQAKKYLIFFKKVPYIANLLLYIIGGYMLVFILFFRDSLSGELYVYVIAIIGALLFLHLYMLARKILHIR